MMEPVSNLIKSSSYTNGERKHLYINSIFSYPRQDATMMASIPEGGKFLPLEVRCISKSEGTEPKLKIGCSKIYQL